MGLHPGNFDSSVANVDGSGSIDIVDALLIAQYYVGLSNEFPGGGAQDNYTFPSYGSVPGGTAPVPWQDNPSLSPIGINPYGTPQITIAMGYMKGRMIPRRFQNPPRYRSLTVSMKT